jgi:predicted nucleic acid-binding Zn ribbon protein
MNHFSLRQERALQRSDERGRASIRGECADGDGDVRSRNVLSPTAARQDAQPLPTAGVAQAAQRLIQRTTGAMAIVLVNPFHEVLQSYISELNEFVELAKSGR